MAQVAQFLCSVTQSDKQSLTLTLMQGCGYHTCRFRTPSTLPYTTVYIHVNTQILTGNQALITWYLLFKAANPVFSGIKISKTMTPTKMEGPMVNQRNTIARTICSGADHMLWRYVITSFSLSASTDIRFTISPTVLSRRALLLSLSACRRNKSNKMVGRLTYSISPDITTESVCSHACTCYWWNVYVSPPLWLPCCIQLRL